MFLPDAQPTWKNVGVFALVYFFCAEVGHALTMRDTESVFATFWPSSGLYLASLLLCAPRFQWRVVVGSLAANLISDVGIHGQTTTVFAGYWTANTLEAICGAYLLRRWAPGALQMSRLADVVRLIVTGIATSAFVGATIGAATVCAYYGGDYSQYWTIWWNADSLGILLVAPLILAWSDGDIRSLRSVSRIRIIEFLVLLTAQVVVTAHVLESAWHTAIPKRYLVLPFMVWAALRFGPRGTTVALVVMVCQAIGSTIAGYGAFAALDVAPRFRIFELQLMLSVAVMSFLIIMAFTAERGTTNRELRRKQSLLQAIHKAQIEFIGETPIPAVFQALLDDLMQLTDSDYSFIGEVRSESAGTPQLRTHTITSLARDSGSRICFNRNSPDDPIASELEELIRATLASGRPVRTCAPGDTGARIFIGAPQAHSLLGLPFHFGNRVVGMIGLAKRYAPFPADLPEFLGPMLATCGHLLEMHRQKSARRIAEEELRKSQARLEAAQVRARLGCWEHDNRSNTTFWSPEVFRLLYCSQTRDPPEFNQIMELIHPEDRKPLLERVDEVAREGVLLQYDYRTNPANGPMRYLSTTIERLELRDDGTRLLAGVVQDVTERREAIETIQRSERELTDFFEHANMGLEWIGLDGRVLRANPAMLEMLGYERDEYIGQHLSKFHVDPLEAHDLIDRIQSGEELENFEAHLRCKDGTGRDVLISLSVCRDQGHVPHARCFVRDVSELRRLERQFYQAQKMDAIGRLAGGVAHDFNNLLTVMTGYASLLNDNLPAGDPRRSLVDEICNAGERAAGLTRQLLTFSRQQVVRVRIFDLNEVVRGMQGMLGRLIGSDIRLTSELDATRLLVRGDKGQLDQVLLNLVVNARDAMPRGGQLFLRTARCETPQEMRAGDSPSEPGPCALLEVRDTGCGMDQATLSRVFEPFFTTKPPGQGTGLGLATVYGIVKQSGGHVAVVSQPGAGAQFRIYLPCLDNPSDDDSAIDESDESHAPFLQATEPR